jgi:hypothetical protein
MPIFTGTAKTQFASTNPSESSSDFDKLVGQALAGLSSIAKTALEFQSSYVEDGTYDVAGVQTKERFYPGTKFSSKRRQFAQRPKATVFIKKKQFGSLSNNYDVRFLDDDEKLYLRCVKALLKRKCDEIAFYESLVNISSVYETTGFLTIDALFDGALEGALNVLGAFSNTVSLDPALGAVFLSSEQAATPGKPGVFQFLQQLYALKERNERSKASAYTRWVEDPKQPDYSGLGPGTGTIELNMVTSISASSSIEGQGSASLQIEDPYQLMLVTDTDIEIALRSAASAAGAFSSALRGSSDFRLALARRADAKLTALRREGRQRDISFEFEDEQPVAILGIVSEDDPTYWSWKRQLTSQADVADALRLGITREEIALINQVLLHMGEYYAAIKASDNTSQGVTPGLARVRDRLRQDFLGQHIIQPMDQVTIFVSGNTKEISPITGANDLLDASRSSVSDEIDSTLIEQERLSIAPEVPFWLYNSIRKRSTFRDDGACIFSGLADSVSDEYSGQSGQFSVSVRCSDNTKYLELSLFTLSPSLNNTYGAVNDPLTPFDLDSAVDPASGLIIADRLELSSINKQRAEFLRIPSGPNRGASLLDRSLLQDKRNNVAIVTHTPGLVYKWKQGIIAATLNEPGGGGATGGLSPFKQPFARLDAANIASILITGQPYDYGTFLEGVSKIGGFNTDSTNISRDFFNYIFDYVGRTNRYYGNFVPAKNQTLDRESALTYFQLQNSLKGLNIQANKRISDLLKLEKDLTRIGSGGVTGTVAVEQEKDRIRRQISDLNSQLTDLQGKLPLGIQISLEGNNTFISVDDANRSTRDSSIALNRRELDRDIVYRLKRKPEDVRFNQDKNFFVVSSDYDTEFTIQSFAAELRSPFQLYDAEYKTPKEIVKSAAEALQLEFFADHNGNLVLRPPRYNRTPLSLMLEVLRREPKDGKGILPTFVKNLFESRANALRTSLLKNELEIAYELYSLGLDQTAVDGNSTAVVPLLKPADSILELDLGAVDSEIERIGKAESGDSRGSFVFGPSSRLSTLRKISDDRAGSSLGTSTRDKLIKAILTKKKLNGENIASDSVKAAAEAQADARLVKLREADSRFSANAALDKISAYLNARRSILRSFSDVIGRSSEKTNLDDVYGIFNLYGGASIGAASLSGGQALSQLGEAFGVKSGSGFALGIPPGLERFVENDLANLDGPRSGKRFIIEDGVIINSGFSHNPPLFTQQTVQGSIDFIATPGGIGSIPTLTAVATDFDSWRQYGFRADQTKYRPDMTSAELQCAPYASLLLSNQRRKIHAGSVTLMGNEHYQLGDNVYVSYRGMIYYVTSMSHDINLNNGTFTTRLELEYGRAIGDIIPTPIDIAGAIPTGTSAIAKSYKNETSVDNRERRTSTGASIINLGTLHANPVLRQQLINASKASQDVGVSGEGIASAFLKSNKKIIENIVLRARARTVMAPDTESYIEVRGYYVDAKTDSQAQTVEQGGIRAASVFFAQAASVEIARLLDGGNPGGTAPTGSSETPLPVADSKTSSPSISNKQVRPPLIIDISKDPTDENRDKLPFPSEEAWVSASPVSIPSGPPSTKTSALRTASALGFGVAGTLTGALIDASGSQSSGGSVPSTGSRTVDLPVNAFDVVLVIEKKVK